MIKKTLRGFIHLLGGLGAGLAIMMVLAAWKLSSGPISLAFLTPYIEHTLDTYHKAFRIRLDDTILTWAGWERTLDIRVLNVRAFGEGGEMLASVPELSLSISARALLHGRLAPKSIEMFRPSLKLVRHRDGSLEVGFDTQSKQSDRFFTDLLGQLLSKPDPANAMSYLARINIFDADLNVVDQHLQSSWKASKAQVQLRRDSAGIKGDVALEINVGGRKAGLAVIGTYLAASERLDLGVEFSEVTPSLFASLSPELAGLAAIDVPLQGTLTFSMTPGGMVESLGFDVAGGAGHLALPVDLAQRFAMLGLAQRVGIAGFEMRGRYEGEPEMVEINALTVEMGDDGTIYLPRPLDHDMPLRTLNARGRYLGGEGRLELDSVELDLQGPRATLAVNLTAGNDGVALGASGVVHDITAEQLPRYWPESIGKNARNWVTGHITKGNLTEARASLQLRQGDGGAFEVVSLNGDMDIKGATVDYLPPMPKAIGTDGTVRFTKNKMDIFITHSAAEGLTSHKGIVSLTGLDEVDQFAAIDLFISGPVQDALRVIDSEPLGFASALNIDHTQTDGTIDAHLNLDFMIEHTLTFDKIKVSAAAKMQDVKIANVVLGHGFDQGRLDLKADRQGMDLTGDVRLGRIPAFFKWRRNFAADVPYRGRFDIASRIENIRTLSDLGIDLSPLHGDFIEGGVGAEIRLTEHDDGKGQVVVKLDLEEVALNAPIIGWSKAVGIPGSALVELSLDGVLISDIPRVAVAAGDLRINGAARYAEDGTGLSKIELSQVSYNRTDLAGVVIPGHDGGWTVSFHGPSFDIEPMFDDLFKTAPGDEDRFGLTLSLSAKIDKVWIAKDRHLKQVTGTFSRANDRWRGIVFDGVVEDGKRFEVRLKPRGKSKRDLVITAEDAGATLKALGYYDNMVGGVLDIAGTFDDAVAGHPLSGRVLITDYRIVRAPALATLVSILSLTGIVDSLQGDGLAFSDFNVPFVLKSGIVDIDNAKATGLSLGYTAKGRIFTHAEIINIEGTMVPAYALNSVLGNIPIIGTLLTGTEEGGGIFAATYSMSGPIEKPKVSVNPLSALTPGILRNLFGALTGGSSTENAGTGVRLINPSPGK